MQCSQYSPAESALYRKVKELFLTVEKENPFIFYNVQPRFYTYQNPLALNEKKMEQVYNQIKNAPLSYLEELYFLFFGVQRYEQQKCAFKHLSNKKSQDIRPYISLSHFCFKNYNKENCDEEIELADEETRQWIKNNLFNLCQSFKAATHCAADIQNYEMKNRLGAMVREYSKRFFNERFSPLFKLKPRHLKFSCYKTTSSKTVMQIRVASGLKSDLLDDLLRHVETVWSNDLFVLKLVKVAIKKADTVVVIPSDKGISYVPEDNNRLVYLSTTLDRQIMKQVLAHEFGHVLGFPDCYIEFFDKSQRELVYYELAPENTNIMCSLKNNVKVERDYFFQLEQSSCIFN